MTPIRPLFVAERRRATYLPHLLLVALLWVLAMTLDYRDQANAAQERAERIDKEFTACLRGQWRAVTEQGAELGCLPVEILKPDEKRKSA